MKKITTGTAASDPHEHIVRECRQLLAQGRFAEVEVACGRILSRSRNHPDALHLLGVVAYAAHRYEDSVRLIGQAISLRRGNPQFHHDLALALLATGEFEAAIKNFRRAVTARPGHALFHSGLGRAFMKWGQVDNAMKSFDRSIALDPTIASSHYWRGQCLLLKGEVREETWREYEWRVPYWFGTPYIAEPRGGGGVLPRPSQLAGTDLRGRRLLVLREQGLGDELFFLRSAPRIKQKGAWLAYRSSAKLAPLLRRSQSIDVVIGAEDALPDSDHTLLVGDLPLVADEGECAAAVLPLSVDPAMLQRAEARLRDAGPAPYLGVTWRAGNPTGGTGLRRSLTKSAPIEEFARAVSCWPGTILVLQRGPTPEELAAFDRVCGVPIADFSVLNDDLELMLAVLSIADDYVGVSNTNMHLRAGLSRAARVLLPFPPEWRWTLDGARSPWFPEFPLYREDPRSGWQPAFGRLAADLRSQTNR